MINHIFQPQGSKICGQCVVAMIGGITIEESIKMFTHNNGTRTRELVWILNRRLNLLTPKQLTKVNKSTVLPKTAVLKVHWNNSKVTHWVLLHNGMVYCSGHGVFPYSDYCFSYLDGRMTSFLEILNYNDKS